MAFNSVKIRLISSLFEYLSLIAKQNFFCE